MERFRSAHFTTSKELKKRKGFRNKVKNLLSAKTTKNELSARGKLEASALGVLPVDLNCLRLDPKRIKKNKNVEVQYITDVTSKILEFAGTVTAQDDIVHREGAVPVVTLPSKHGSQPDIVAEVKDYQLNECFNSLRASKSEKSNVEVQHISATILQSVSDRINTTQNESEKPGDSASKTTIKKLRNRKEKKRKSRTTEFSASELIVPGGEERYVVASEKGSDPEVVAEGNNEASDQSFNSLLVNTSEMSDVGIPDISATDLLPVSDMIKTIQIENEKSGGGSGSKTSGKILGNRKEKKRKLKILDITTSERTPPYGGGTYVVPSENERVFEVVEEVINVTLNQSCNSLRASTSEKSDDEVKDISTTFLLPAIDRIKTTENESEKLVEGSASKTSGKKILKRNEKRRKSKLLEFSTIEHKAPDVGFVVSPHCENSTENNDFRNAFVSGSEELVRVPMHNVHSEESVSSLEVQPHSTAICDIEPLIVKSEGQNSMKDLIAARLESVCIIGEGDRNYVGKVAQNMKENLCYRNKACDDRSGVHVHTESGGEASPSVETTCRLNVPQTFVREKLESLTIEESNHCDVSFLRDIFHTHSKAQSMLSNADGTEGPETDIHDLENDRFLLIIKPGDSVYIRGKLVVSVIVGCVEILGYKLKPSNGLEKYTVFSPRGVSLLSMTSCVSNNTCVNDDYLRSICAHNQLPYNLIDSLGESGCVLLLEKAESNVADYLNLYLPNKLFPILSAAKGKKKYSLAEKKLECELLSENSEENVKLICKRDEWDILSDVILSQNSNNKTNCTVICGGKGVGKSTLLRFLINRSLSSHNKILCLDFDLGQAEFTVPGCISAVIIKKPLLGPNFTHLLQPERMVFIGAINVSNCPTQYLEGAKFIIDHCKSQPEFQYIPWFVNTMGFCKGLGVELMMHLLHMVSPTNVIQIQSCSNKRNFPKHLEAEYVRYYKSSLKYITYINRNLSYDLHLIPSAAESKSEGQEAEWGLDSRTMREIVVMSYLSGITAPPNYSLTELVPYVCGFKDLKLCVSHETINPNSVLSVMNGSFVALCICDKGEMLQPSDPNLPCILLQAPVCQCLGFGIIRGVDMEERQLYMISPLPVDEIQKVNCLVMGTVQLPSSVLLREATCGVVGHVPYTIIGPGQPTGRLSQKSSYRLLLSSAVEL